MLAVTAVTVEWLEFLRYYRQIQLILNFSIVFLARKQINFEIFSNRATAYYKLELYRKCIQDCDAALKLDANCVKAYLKKGTCIIK